MHKSESMASMEHNHREFACLAITAPITWILNIIGREFNVWFETGDSWCIIFQYILCKWCHFLQEKKWMQLPGTGLLYCEFNDRYNSKWVFYMVEEFLSTCSGQGLSEEKMLLALKIWWNPHQLFIGLGRLLHLHFLMLWFHVRTQSGNI